MTNNPTLVFVPTYNERENAIRLCSDILALDLGLDVLFLDDNSPDGTGEALDAMAADHPNVHVIHRAGKLGVGSAHLDGIAWAYERGYRTLATMDCDFTHMPKDLPELLRQSEDHDVVVGSRYLRQDSLPGWTLTRRLLTSSGHLLTTILLRMRYDATGAFRVYRLDRVPRELFALVRSSGYSFFFESLYAVHVNGLRVKEVPIALPARTYGHSKMRFSDALTSLARLSKVAAGQLLASRYQLPRAATVSAARDGVREKDDGGWDEYWLDSRSPVRRAYGAIASLYREYLIKRNLDRLVAEHFTPGSRLLHAGCGSGQVDTGVSRNHAVTALDLSAPALKVYEGLHDGAHKLVRGTIFSLPVRDACLDGIYHLGVMEHFDERQIHDILGEFHRVLKPGGRMLVFWPPRFGLSVRALAAIHFVLNWVLRRGVKLHPDEITLVRSRAHVTEMFERAGFQVDDYYFGRRDLFTYCMIVVSKRPSPPEAKMPAESADLPSSKTMGAAN